MKFTTGILSYEFVFFNNLNKIKPVDEYQFYPRQVVKFLSVNPLCLNCCVP